ncbi:MAG: ribosome-associated translation inhibitor RaiA [Clostridia bacterium]|nr:ribosome-associated translation inhibitor RaiA [Clostridia bacterium]MBR5380904.1 ribosome-associated translation inhibitor RaiA [Clostridia bacterium]MBR5750850.1 ribosome-associated translation inhibitor RaiA [Clostridia bacterium]
MNIKYYGRFMDVSDSLRDYAEKKINKLDWFFGPDSEAQAKFTLERGGKNIAEITITHRGMLFRAEEISTDMYASIDSAVDKISRQIRRHRTKLDKKFRSPAPLPPVELPEDEPVAEEERKVVKVKRFQVKPMSVDDAIMQMEQLGHSFYLFDNADTGKVCVLYLRKDGDYGLLEPEE